MERDVRRAPERFPERVESVLGQLVRGLSELLRDDLTGVYAHGSLAMKSFNPVSSDIDVLIVVRDALDRSSKQKILDLFFELSEVAPAKGFEMSVVTLRTLRRFEHPTPYELHFGTSHMEDFRPGKVDLDTPRMDPDLAAHFMITKHRGIALFGEPIGDIFPDVPHAAYLDSIARDSEWSYSCIEKGPDSGSCAVPPYAVLNFCRVLAFIREGLITSKGEGGAWGIRNVPEQYRPIIRQALGEYANAGSSDEVDAELLKGFAGYAIDVIRAAQA